MVPFAEELGHIGGDGVHERNQFFAPLLGVLKDVAVIGKALQTQCSHAAAKAGLEHLALLRPERDAGVAVDQAAQQFKLPVAQGQPFAENTRFGHAHGGFLSS